MANLLFINFRGKDIRYGFASHLIDALETQKIKFFIDTHEQKGRDLKHLFTRIEEATVALVILSSKYAESKWCLEELATIMKRAEKEEMVVIPIFYKVRPEDVRKQKGVFGNMFWRHTEESSCEEMHKWKVALEAVSNKIGFTFDYNRSEAKFINKVVEEVGKVLTAIASKDNSVKKVKTYDVPLAQTWACIWFGSAVGLIGLVLGLLAETLYKFALPAMIVLAGQDGSIGMIDLYTRLQNVIVFLWLQLLSKLFESLVGNHRVNRF